MPRGALFLRLVHSTMSPASLHLTGSVWKKRRSVLTQRKLCRTVPLCSREWLPRLGAHHFAKMRGRLFARLRSLSLQRFPCACPRRAAEPQRPTEGEPRFFTLPTADGAKAALGLLRGSAVVMHFFAAWCESSREELPGSHGPELGFLMYPQGGCGNSRLDWPRSSRVPLQHRRQGSGRLRVGEARGGAAIEGRRSDGP